MVQGGRPGEGGRRKTKIPVKYWVQDGGIGNFAGQTLGTASSRLPIMELVVHAANQRLMSNNLGRSRGGGEGRGGVGEEPCLGMADQSEQTAGLISV